MAAACLWPAEYRNIVLGVASSSISMRAASYSKKSGSKSQGGVLVLVLGLRPARLRFRSFAQPESSLAGLAPITVPQP